MKPRLKSTRAARDLIKAHEPFHGEAVRRGKRWVVGYGHTAAARPGVTLSRDDAELLLLYDVLQAETAVHAALGEDLREPVRDALVSFAASVGLNAFKVSDVARLARAGKLDAAASALETWVRAEEDGRLVTSDRLVKRRAAEKALLLNSTAPQAISPSASAPANDAAAPGAPEPEPAAPADAPEISPASEPAAAESPQAPESPDAGAAVEAPAAPGPLIDVDIAFETLEDAAPAPAGDAPGAAETETSESDVAEPGTPEPPESAAPEAPEPASGDPEAPSAIDAEDLVLSGSDPDAGAPGHERPAPGAVFTGQDDDAGADAVKASQDAAIRAVMSRMAGEISQSVSVAGVRRPAEPAAGQDAAAPQEPEPPEPAGAPEPESGAEPAPEPEAPAAESQARDLSGVVLGYFFLQPDVVGWDFIDDDAEAAAEDGAGVQAEAEAEAEAAPDSHAEPEPVTEPVSEPVSEPEAEPDAQARPAGEPDAAVGEAAGEAAGPGRAVASPAPGPVYATVSVSPVAKPETAPPHPAEAPAAAPGLSGESEGPDHADETEAEDAGEDETELEPAIVAGPEARYIADETPPGAVEGRGDWVHGANLVAGGALTGLGAWQIGANLDAYFAAGLGYNWFGPAAFAGGALLLVSSGWVVVGKALSKKR